MEGTGILPQSYHTLWPKPLLLPFPSLAVTEKMKNVNKLRCETEPCSDVEMLPRLLNHLLLQADLLFSLSVDKSLIFLANLIVIRCSRI